MRIALNSSVVLELTTEGERPFHRGKWILQGITVCLVSTILGTVWCPGGSNCEQGSGTCLFLHQYRHSTRMYLMKEKQGGPIPTGLKRWPLKLIKHLADTTCISPAPAGPAGCCPLNFLYLVNLKFRVRAPNGCRILPKFCMQPPLYS